MTKKVQNSDINQSKDENELEIALHRAVKEPGYRPDFFKLLLKSNVFLPCDVQRTTGRNELKEEQDKISIPYWRMKNGSQVVPFFTSLSVMQKAIKEETGFIVMPTKKMFEMTKGDTLIMNPGLSSGKEFLPHEIEILLEHDTNHLTKKRMIGEGTPVHISAPTNVPTKMFDSLKIFFENRSQVEAAYWVFIDDKTFDKKPCFFVSIEAKGDIQQIINDACGVANDTITDDLFVDFTHIIPGDSRFGSFISKACKFYERSSLSPMKIVQVLISAEKHTIGPIISEILQHEGISSTLLDRNDKLLDELKNNSYSVLILTNTSLLPKEIVQLIDRIRYEYENMKIIVWSGYNDKEYIEETINAGASFFFSIPVEQAAVIRCVKTILGSIE